MTFWIHDCKQFDPDLSCLRCWSCPERENSLWSTGRHLKRGHIKSNQTWCLSFSQGLNCNSGQNLKDLKLKLYTFKDKYQPLGCFSTCNSQRRLSAGKESITQRKMYGCSCSQISRHVHHRPVRNTMTRLRPVLASRCFQFNLLALSFWYLPH